MTDLLLPLGALTLGGSAAVAALALASRSTRTRYGAKWRCWAWLLLCLRLAVPVSVLSQEDGQTQGLVQLPTLSDRVIYQRAPATPAVTPTAPGTVQPGQSLPSGSQSAASQVPSSEPAALPEFPNTPPGSAAGADGFSLSLSQVLLVLWLGGAAVMLLWALVQHLRFLLYLRRWARPAADPEAIQTLNRLGARLGLDRRPRLLTCPGLRVPMLAGLFRPALLLPEEAPEGDALRYSLLHELTHFRRRDIWLKALALWVNALHWFNPLMWYMVRLVERDTELACDEAALAQLPAEEHGAYGRTILDAVGRLNRRHIQEKRSPL